MSALKEKWEEVMRKGGGEYLHNILAENAVFHSPLVHTPQAGREKAYQYLNAASKTFENTGFQYVREIIDGKQIMLEFVAEIDGIHINGIDIIAWNDEGKISDFKVFIRPLKAINMISGKMAEQLEKLSE